MVDKWEVWEYNPGQGLICKVWEGEVCPL